LLELPQIPVQVLLMPLEIDDRVSNELSRSMKGHIATSLDLEQLNTLRGKKLGRSQKVLFLGRPAECHDRRMLDEQQNVLGYDARDTVASEAALQL
jgi:hypothetical protein